MIKVEGKVTFPSGAPAKGVHVRLVDKSGSPVTVNVQQFTVKTDASGEFQMYLPEQAIEGNCLKATAESASGKVLKQDLVCLTNETNYSFILGRESQEEEAVTVKAQTIQKEKNKYLIPVIIGSVVIAVITILILKRKGIV